MTANTPPETLLAHTGWMRRLALTLVRDDAQADDVVQDAVAAALRSPPRDPVALPAWLATAVRNGAKQLWRGESRRGAREQASARPEATPGTAEVVARAEEHGIVVQAVLGLDEPHRSALLLRFYDDLPPREVAARLGVPVETARARIRRGLDELRKRLDAMHGGGGSAWKLALVPLTVHHGLTSAGGAGTGAAAGAKSTTGAMVMAGTGSTLGVSAIALVIGFGAGWLLIGKKADERANASEAKAATVEREAADLSADLARREAEAKSLREQMDRLDADYASSMKEAERIGAERDALSAELERLRASTASRPSAAPIEKKGARFAFAEYGALDDIDWKTVASSLSAMTSIAPQLVEAMEKKDQKAVMALVGRLQKENGPLLPVAQALHEKVPGTSFNGAFTNPAFMINAIAATLEMSGKPLSKEQTTAAESVGRKYAAEDAARAGAYTEATFQLQKEIEEADVRRRFFDAVREVLTEDQRTSLWPAASRDRGALDVFSDGVFLYTVAAAVPYRERSELPAKVASRIFAAIELPEARREEANRVIGAWVDGLPADILEAKFDSAAQLGGTSTPALRAGMRQTLLLLERLMEDLKLEGDEAAAVRNCPLGVVPLQIVKAN